MKKQKGFTLIELLVVIAIIGLLSTLAVVALNNARMKSRDAKRISDINHIQTALELYFNDLGSYPAGVTGGQPIASGGVTYMASVPSNPTPVADGICSSGSAYTYTQTSSGSSYTLQYCLGGQTGEISSGIKTAYPGSVK
jgi:prepilin-type N-terminal cleavage/methylation domain-containing protein